MFVIKVMNGWKVDEVKTDLLAKVGPGVVFKTKTLSNEIVGGFSRNDYKVSFIWEKIWEL